MLAERRIEKRETTWEEIFEIREAIERTLRDAQIGLDAGQSPERCFNIAYDAARMVAIQAIRCSGYRIRSSHGAHFYTFQALEVAVGSEITTFVDYFNLCREKRNEVCYDCGGVTETEVVEILKRAQELRDYVEAWLSKSKSQFVKHELEEKK